MRKIRNRKNKKQKKMLIIGSLSLLLFLCVGYAAFQTNLNITAKGNIKGRNNLYVSASGSDTKGNGTRERPYQTIQKAYNSAWDNATIWIMDNITVDETIEFDEEKTVTLTSETNEVNSLLRGKEDLVLLQVTAGTTTLTNITLDGQNQEANHSLLRVYKSTVNLNEGTTIQNNIDTEDYGGGVTLGAEAVMTIDGAKIINNQALAGAIIARHATLTINSGELSGNSSRNGGAIFFGDLDGSLTMNGGKITQNKATAYGGGGIYLASTNMIMNGGEITYNTAITYGGGIQVSIASNSDGNSTFKMKNGTISNNTATSGGGVYIANGHNYNYIGGNITNNIPDNVYNNN